MAFLDLFFKRKEVREGGVAKGKPVAADVSASGDATKTVPQGMGAPVVGEDSPDTLIAKGGVLVDGAASLLPEVTQESSAGAGKCAPVALRVVTRNDSDKGVVKGGGTPDQPILRVVERPGSPVPEVASAERAAAGKEAATAEERPALVRPKMDQRALYYQLMDGLYDALLILDDQGFVVDVNQRVGDVLGYSREDAWDLPIEKVIFGMTRPMFEHLKRTALEKNNLLIDARCCRKDGTSFAGEIGASLLHIAGRSNLVLSIRSVEKLKSKMTELKRFEAAFAAATAPLFICDGTSRVQSINGAALDILGVTEAAGMVGRQLSDLLPTSEAGFLRALSGEKCSQRIEVTAQDRAVTLELALAPLFISTRIEGVVGVLRRS